MRKDWVFKREFFFKRDQVCARLVRAPRAATLSYLVGSHGRYILLLTAQSWGCGVASFFVVHTTWVTLLNFAATELIPPCSINVIQSGGSPGAQIASTAAVVLDIAALTKPVAVGV